MRASSTASRLSTPSVQGAQAPAPLLFSYSPPQVTLVTGAGVSSPAQCLPSPQNVTASGYGVPASGLVAVLDYPAYASSCFPCVANPPKQLLIRGASFGPASSPITVTIGPNTCLAPTHDHNSIRCTLPQGFGDSNAVVVTAGGRSNAASPAAVFAYDPPSVLSVVPNRADAISGQGLALAGHNFGSQALPAAICSRVEAIHSSANSRG